MLPKTEILGGKKKILGIFLRPKNDKLLKLVSFTSKWNKLEKFIVINHFVQHGPPHVFACGRYLVTKFPISYDLGGSNRPSSNPFSPYMQWRLQSVQHQNLIACHGTWTTPHEILDFTWIICALHISYHNTHRMQGQHYSLFTDILHLLFLSICDVSNWKYCKNDTEMILSQCLSALHRQQSFYIPSHSPQNFHSIKPFRMTSFGLSP